MSVSKGGCYEVRNNYLEQLYVTTPAVYTGSQKGQNIGKHQEELRHEVRGQNI